jgi:hypothetical protein
MLQLKEQLNLAAKLLRLTVEEVQENSEVIDSNGALYVSIAVKGGPSLIVGLDRTVLFANSSIGYSQHLQEFENGRRTPLEDFD